MALVTIKGLKSVADLDLQIRGGGGHLDPEIRWGPSRKKKNVSALRTSVWSTNKRGGRAPPGPSPASTTEKGWASKGFPLATRIMFNYLPKKALPA